MKRHVRPGDGPSGEPTGDPEPSGGGPRADLLFVANFPADTGYAWQHIERLFARLADRLVDRGVRARVAYPAISEPPDTLRGSAARAVRLDARLDSWRSLAATLRFVRRAGVRLLYLTDRPLRSWKYALLRICGVRSIIVHDRISGERTPPGGLKRALKWALARVPGWTPDTVIAVSEFVRRRDVRVALIPERKIVTVPNGFPVRPVPEEDRTRRAFGIDEGTPIVACACRASPHKGVDVLLRAFDRLEPGSLPAPPPVLLYLGDGPQMEELRSLRRGLGARDRVVFGGYREGATELLSGADLFVVPSVWQDAFPSAVLEPMSLGKPVVASEVGGIPEMIEHGKSGLLVPPDDEAALAEAMRALLADPERRRRLGEGARRRVAERFSLERQLERILRILERGLGLEDRAQADAAGRSVPR